VPKSTTLKGHYVCCFKTRRVVLLLIYIVSHSICFLRNWAEVQPPVTPFGTYIMQIITRNIGQSPTWLMTWQHQLQLPHIVLVGFSQLCLLIASAGNLAKLQVATHSERCCSHSHCCTPPVWVPIFVTMGPWQQGASLEEDWMTQHNWPNPKCPVLCKNLGPMLNTSCVVGNLVWKFSNLCYHGNRGWSRHKFLFHSYCCPVNKCPKY